MNVLYLGWGNPRNAWHLRDVVVLDDGTKTVALSGDAGRAAYEDISGLTHHLTGHRRSEAARKVLQDAPQHMHQRHAYDALFDKHFED